MSTALTYEDLFVNYLIENQKIRLSKDNLLRKISGIPSSLNEWLIVIHEKLRRTFLPYLIVDENENYLFDSKFFVVSDYSGHYLGIDCITLGKRINKAESIAWGYQWKFSDLFQSSISNESLLEIEDQEHLWINLNVLGFPDSPTNFCQAFVRYLSINKFSNIVVDNNYLVQLLFKNNLPSLNLEDVVNG